MDSIFQRARELAQETAKKSQDFAKEAAKELAAKSKELAVEATKKADQIKAFAAAELSPGSAPAPAPPSEEELEAYGITPELREFVKNFTIKTFREYDLKTLDGNGARQDLTEWQEKHAVLLLQAIPEISDFRYVLCPRRMRESVFWKIYFKLVENYIAPFEAHASVSRNAPEQGSQSSSQTSGEKTEQESTKVPEANSKPGSSEHDLDAYLLGALDGHDETPGDDDSDADFDRLVNSTGLESDGDDAKRETASSDGELVEIPS